MKFKVGDIIKSRNNNLVRYKVINVNKESIDVVSLDISPVKYYGQEFELFYK